MTTKSTSPRTSAILAQLLLVTDESTPANHWQLDDETREIGRKGVAQARAILQSTRSTSLDLAA
jgi:hypothetical protein